MKKVIVGFSIGLCLLGLAGCSSKKEASETKSKDTIKVSETYSTTEKSERKSSSSSEKTAESSAEKSKSSAKEAALWDSQKASTLQSFMNDWGSTMGQTYKEYQPKQNVDFYGLDLPDGVLGDTKIQPIAVNDQIVSAEWSENGKSAAEYTIVSVYSDAETAAYAVKHVYFFGFNNNQPIVLVSMQNQGMPDGALHFSATENKELNAGFQNIATGTASQTTQTTQTSNAWTMDEAVQFYEDTYKNPANAISKDLIWENYDRSCWSVTEQSGDRIVLHWTNLGAGGSYDEFIKGGDTTELIVYGGNAAYPNDPSAKYTIRNSDHVVIKTEEF